MNIEELDAYNLDDAVKFHDSLNPRLWDSGENLLPEVREKLLAISADFEEFLGLDAMSVEDITLSGSNAAYNYTDHSDIDLHLVVNMPQGDLAKVYRELFDAKKYQYNDQHNITIGGFDVELYVQDSDQPHHSQGIYSVKHNKWLSVPRRRKADIDDSAVQSKYQDLGARIENMIGSSDLTQLDRMWHKIKTMRQTGLAREGEFGVDNVAFKLLRATGLIEKLAAARTAARDAELSLTERRRKKKKNRVRYGYGGYWTPGFNFGSDSGDSGGGDGGGGESIQEASTPDGVSATTKMFLEQNTANTADIVKDFVSFCVKEIGIKQQPRLQLRRDPAWSQRNHSFGQFDPATNELNVSVANRHVMDILRTVAHELVHHSQQEQQDLPPSAGETGSEYENEANARAGELMREYGQQHPELFEPGAVAEGWREKLGGAALAAACVAGTPGCATTGQLAHGAQIAARTAKTMQGRDIKGIARAELEQEIRNLARAQRGDANAQNLSRIHQLQKRQQQQNESSGYIPTQSERNNPKFKMALSPDVQPGAIGLNANRLGLKTGSQGEPTLLMKELQNALREFKETGALPLVEEQENLFEISMSPSSLKKLSAQTGALAGMEFEMIVPGVKGEDQDQEPDYDYDESTSSIDNICNFFYDGDFNSRRQIDDLRERMRDAYEQWADNQVNDDWADQGMDFLYQYVKNNVDDETIISDLGLESDEEGNSPVIGRPEWAQYAEYCMNEQNDTYDEALSEFRDDWFNDSDKEENWLESEDLERMSDVESRYGSIVTWPHWSDPDAGETDVEQVADEFSNAIGREVRASKDYHSRSVERPSTRSAHYIVEPDGSLDPDDSNDAGLEFVSPPLPIEELLSDLNKVKAWADRTGCYTNDSTGLHINVSVPGWTGGTDQLDYVKLALLLGDEFVLDSFGRAGNTYAKSAMGKIRDAVRKSPDRAQELMDRMKSGMDQLASKIVHSRSTDKYTSINVKDGYIEFRSPGGDWLNDNFAEIDNTLRRFTVALSAAVDPEAYRQEYLKKLYKLLDVSSEKDPLSYFAKFAAGELPRAALKSFVRQAQLERGVKRGKETGPMWWRVYKEGKGAANGAVIEVVASSREEAIDNAAQEWGVFSNEYRRAMYAEPLRPYDGVDTSREYELYDRRSGAVVATFRASDDDAALAKLDQFRAGQVRTQGITVPQANEIYGVRSSGVTTVPPRDRPSTEPIPGSTLDLQRQRLAQAQSGGNWGILITSNGRFVRMPGTGDPSDRALRRFPSREAAEEFLAQTRAENPNMRTDIEIREIPADYQSPGQPAATSATAPNQEPSDAAQIPTIDIDVEPAPAPQPAGMGQWNGQWKVLVGGQEVYRFGGVGNSQADANRIGRDWILQQIRQGTLNPVEGANIEILPVMSESLREYRMPQPSQGPGRYRDLNEPLGPETPPTMPAGTVKVDVSDVYDWYKLGQHISNMKGLGQHDFGQGPPSAIMSFGDEDLEHQYIQALKKTGLTTTDIDPVDPNQPPGMPRQKTDPTYNVDENFDDSRTPGRKSLSKRAGVEVRPEIK